MRKYLHWRRNNSLRLFVLSACAVLVLLLVLTEVRQGRTADPKGGDSRSAFTLGADAQFPGCPIIEPRCGDTGCSFYNACDGQQEECRIYDCGTEYGIYIKTPSGKTVTKREPKPDLAAVDRKRQACAGTMEVLSQGCEDARYRAKVGLKTAGECPIESFLVRFENIDNQMVVPRKNEDGTYTLEADRCDQARGITASAEGGVTLEF